MLAITSLQFLYKQTGLLDSLFKPKSKVKITLNETIQICQLESTAKSTKVNWNTSLIPRIQLPPNKKTHDIQFQFFKESQNLGKAKSFINFGQNKKDCLDILNKNFVIIGKMVYEAKWQPKTYYQNMITIEDYNLKSKKGYKYPQNQNYQNYQSKNNTNQKLEVLDVKKTQPAYLNQKQKNKKIESSDQQSMAVDCCGCFGGSRYKRYLDESELKKFQNNIVFYSQKQLSELSIATQSINETFSQQKILQPIYYSKRFYTCNNKN